MTTNARAAGREAHGQFVAKINNLVAQGRESLIANLVAEYEEAGHKAAESTQRAA
jgi:hypothetical protein